MVKYFGTSNMPICYASLTAAYFSASTLSLGLSGARDPGSRMYIGDPPAELEMLVSDTLLQATLATGRWDQYDAADCTPHPETEACKAARGGFVAAANFLDTTLDRWGPYL